MTNQEYFRTLVINQLGDSPSYNQILQWLADNYDRLQLILDYVQTINVFEARGVWLDLIGAIVGQSREIPNAILFEYFGFDEQGGLEFDQGRFYEEGDPLTASSILPDDEYRVVILARVARNWGDISEVGVIEALQNITNSQNVLMWRRPPAAFEVYIGAEITSNIRAILATQDILPRGAGIGIDVLIQGDGFNVFGFEDDGYAAFDDAPFATEII
jgi:hypothetical protein